MKQINLDIPKITGDEENLDRKRGREDQIHQVPVAVKTSAHHLTKIFLLRLCFLVGKSSFLKNAAIRRISVRELFLLSEPKSTNWPP